MVLTKNLVFHFYDDIISFPCLIMENTLVQKRNQCCFYNINFLKKKTVKLKLSQTILKQCCREVVTDSYNLYPACYSI